MTKQTHLLHTNNDSLLQYNCYLLYVLHNCNFPDHQNPMTYYI